MRNLAKRKTTFLQIITFGKVIGEGGKSTVYEGSLKRDSKSIPVALKKYRVARMSPRCRKQIESEAEYLSTLNHGNVIKYFGACLEDDCNGKDGNDNENFGQPQ